MKFNRLFAMTLAAAVLFTGCSNDTSKKDVQGDPTDTASAYETLSQNMALWDGSNNMSTFAEGTIFTEYQELPSAASFTGQFMQQAGENGNETFAALTFDYGDSYYYTYTFLGDGVDFAAAVETGSTDASSTEETQSMGEYVDEETFNANVAFGIPQLAFEADQVQSTTTGKDKESGNTLYTFYLEPSTCEAPVITLLEQLQYIDTELVPVTAEVSSMSCTAAYADDELVGLTYKFSADLTAEGEVMSMDYDYTYSLVGNGEEVDFALPNIEYIVTTTTTTTEELPVVE